MSAKTFDRIVYGTAVVLLVLALAVGLSWPWVFDYVRTEKLNLNPHSDSFKLWVKTPIPMYLEVYLFNWTNSREFLLNKKTKPEFEEVGPFVFQEVHERVNITWNSNGTVTYNQTRKWNFVPEKSVDLSVPIVNLNVIATTVAKTASNYKDILKLLIDFLNSLYKEELLVKRPAREWLFDGMEDKLLDFFRKFVPVPYDKFGWFYSRNMSSSYDGRFNVKTGEDNIYDLGMMTTWNNVHETNFFKEDCRVVRGSSGELFAPLEEKQNNVTIFVTDFCSPVTLSFDGPDTIEGVRGFRYVGGADVFDNGTNYPNSKCYCTGECSPSGVRNVTSCRQAPLFLSFPHFYLADPSYTKAVVGMRPNRTEHEFRLTLEPVTGIPLEVRAQLQLNVLLRPIKFFHMFTGVPKIYVPMMWFRERAKATHELASRGQVLSIFEKLGFGLACGLACAGVLLVILRMGYVWYTAKSKRFEMLLNEETNKEETQQD